MRPTTTDLPVLSVSELNFQAKTLLESQLGTVWVSGEISNFSRPSSGHWYFTLKDSNAQIRCAMFRGANRYVKDPITEGAQVVVRAKASLYTARGDYQLIVEDMQAAGAGALQIAFEKLKKQLAAEGLFSEEHKKPLPRLPRCIGVVTSATGAALQDILKVLRRRFASIPVIVYPCQVQGDAASAQIVSAIQIANQRQECDVLIVGRGGGSLEDLWCFNEPNVAYAIFDSKIPVVSAVGHEVDITIADLVADLRAATPSAAAEAVSPDQSNWQRHIEQLRLRLQQRFSNLLQTKQLQLDKLSRALKHPKQKLEEHAQRVDQLEQRLLQRLTTLLEYKQLQLDKLTRALKHPKHQLAECLAGVEQLKVRLQQAQQRLLQHKAEQLQAMGKALHGVSPLAVLERGYAVVSAADGQLVTRAKQINVGETLVVKMYDAEMQCVREK